ncbi:hypothetical protein AAA162_17650, partial [Parabacteroides johnsonii]|uniref:hypothetical protein n=1 Tax=Parabacteroides johnsonii TaxID=387661 RepID=UPI0032BFDD9F
MDFRHLIVTCLFSMLRLSFETQKIKENYAILYNKRDELRSISSFYLSREGMFDYFELSDF